MGGLTGTPLPPGFFPGLVAGGGLAALNLFLLRRVLQTAIRFSPLGAALFVFFHYLVRYLLAGVVFFLGFSGGFLHWGGVLTGLLLTKFAVVITPWLDQTPGREVK